jgi:CHAD domain-containing protein
VKELFPESVVFLSFLEKQVKKLSKDTQKSIASLNSRDLANDINTLNNEIRKLSKTDAELKKRLIKCVGNAFKVARRRLNHIDSTQPVTIHVLRIDFRKFRYQIEIIHPLLSSFPKENLERMTRYQNKMGEVQNLGVLLQKLNSFKIKKPNVHLESVTDHFTRLHQEAINTFISSKDELITFWRLDRKSAFPWEAGDLPRYILEGKTSDNA